MDTPLHFPHVILSGEGLVMWDRPGQMSAGFFEDLARTTDWNYTCYVERRPVLVIARHQNLWVVTQDAGRWGNKQRSC